VKTLQKKVSVNQETLRMLQAIKEAFGVKVSDSAVFRKAIEQFYYDVCKVGTDRAKLPQTGQ
jgi:hypothetical protein